MKKFCEGKAVEVINVYVDAERNINKMTFNAIRNIVMYRMGISESDLNSQSIKSSNRVAASFYIKGAMKPEVELLDFIKNVLFTDLNGIQSWLEDTEDIYDYSVYASITESDITGRQSIDGKSHICEEAVITLHKFTIWDNYHKCYSDAFCIADAYPFASAE
jgi:hypothetical protein